MAEESVQQSEQRYRTLFETLIEGFCTILHSQALAMELTMTAQARIELDQNGLSQCVRGRLVGPAQRW